MSEPPTGRMAHAQSPEAAGLARAEPPVLAQAGTQPATEVGKHAPLAECVRQSLDEYFEALGGHPATDLYDLVLNEVERPLLEVVMRESRNNLCRAAAMLGLNRATLRKKLQKHGLDPRQR